MKQSGQDCILSIELDSCQFEGAVDFTWHENIVYQYSCLQKDDQRIRFLETLIPKLNFMSSHTDLEDQMVTAAISSPNLQYRVNEINSNLIPNRIKHAFNQLKELCDQHLTEYSISTEIALLDAKIKRYGKDFCVYGPNSHNSITIKNTTPREYNDGTKTWYDPSLYNCRVQVHFHLITPESEYFSMQRKTKSWRQEYEYSMKKSSGFLEGDEAPKFAQYVCKNNVLPCHSKVSFNRFRFDLPFLDEKTSETRLKWLESLPYTSTFKGKNSEFTKIKVYLRTIMRTIQNNTQIDQSKHDICRLTAVRHARTGTLSELLRKRTEWDNAISSVIQRSEEEESRELYQSMIAYEYTKAYELYKGKDPPYSLAA